MLRNMTRSRLIQLWFAAIALIFVAGVAVGVTMALTTWMTLAALSLVPLAIALVLWPGVQPRSASEVLHDRNRV
jgi:membrane protein implicated in regulation of membrane protease activity